MKVSFSVSCNYFHCSLKAFIMHGYSNNDFNELTNHSLKIYLFFTFVVMYHIVFSIKFQVNLWFLIGFLTIQFPVHCTHVLIEE